MKPMQFLMLAAFVLISPTISQLRWQDRPRSVSPLPNYRQW